MRLALLAVAAAALLAGGCNRASPTGAPEAKQGATAAPAERQAPATSGEPAAPPPHDEERDLTLPAGTRLPVVLDTSVGSDTSRVDERVEAHIERPIVVRGTTAIPAGSDIAGVVTDATRSGRVKGRAHVAVRFDTLVPRDGEARYRIRTASVGRLAPATKRKDAIEILAPAAGGAIIGGLVGGREGALAGAAVGGGAGTAVVLSTRGEEVRLPRGSALTLTLIEPLTLHVR